MLFWQTNKLTISDDAKNILSRTYTLVCDKDPVHVSDDHKGFFPEQLRAQFGHTLELFLDTSLKLNFLSSPF